MLFEQVTRLAELRNVQTVTAVADVRSTVADWRRSGDSIAFVPTMGNLHAGHLSLAALAAGLARRVVMSVFVNPTQFGPGEDFAVYPRTLAEDTALVTAAGTVDLMFVPEAQEVYPFGVDNAVRLQLPPLSRELCGASRPGHFEGVASVVCRLLNIVAPDSLVLGQKDYQQFVLMQRMIADLHMPVSLQMGPTYREADGLAMSSRNRYLDGQQRQQAPALHTSLARARDDLRAGMPDRTALVARVQADLERAGFKVDYVAIRRAADLAEPPPGSSSDRLVVLGAGWLGRARLIDNLLV